MHPILLNSCARAATAVEARYRINTVIAPSHGAFVLALDDGAQQVVRRVADQPQWATARFFAPLAAPSGDGHGPEQVRLRAMDGSRIELGEALDGTDAAVMVATADDGADVASAVGDACSARGIMTAALVLGDGRATRAAVSALRPHARVILVTSDEHDLTEVLTALRA